MLYLFYFYLLQYLVYLNKTHIVFTLTFVNNINGKNKLCFTTGIDMVKISDQEAAARYNIIHTPALLYFRKRVPLLYDGRSTNSYLS